MEERTIMQTLHVPAKSIHFRNYNGTIVQEGFFELAEKELTGMPYEEHILMVPDTFEFSTTAVLKLVS